MPLTLAGSPLQACDSRFDAPSGFVRRNSQRADDGISQVELASQQGPTRLIPTHTKCGKQCGSAFFRKPTLSCKNNTIKRLTGAQKRDRDVSIKRYITTLYCDFSIFDTVENTVLATALVLDGDSSRCGHSISDQSATPKFILRPADDFPPESGEKPNQAAANDVTAEGAISPSSCCSTALLPATRSTLAIRRRSSPSIMP